MEDIENFKLVSGALCIVEVRNTSPDNLQVKIGGGCRFVYQDDNGNESGSYTDLHNQIDVASGRTLTFTSNKPQECVKRIELTLIAASTLEPGQHTYQAFQQTDPKHCLAHKVWDFGPKASVERTRINDKLFNNLELK